MIRKIIALFFILIPINSHALIEVDITRGNLDPLPMAVSPLAIDEKSNFIAMNIAMHPKEKPIKYPMVAFMLFKSIPMT